MVNSNLDVMIIVLSTLLTGLSIGFWAGWRMRWTHMLRTIKAQVINSPQTPIKVWDLGKDVPDRKIVCSKLDIDGQIVWDVNFGANGPDSQLIRELASAITEMLSGGIVADRAYIYGGDMEKMAAYQQKRILTLSSQLAKADNEIDELKAETSRLDAALGKYE